MQRGGCHPADGCETGHDVPGADFKFLAANVVRKDDAKTLFRPYAIRSFQGKKIGFIGMTLEGTPSIVSPSGIANLSFLDEAATANRYARELRRKHGVKAIVVLLHEGGGADAARSPRTRRSYTGCDGFTGPIVDIVSNTTDDVDLFITGHTHQPYNCVIDGRPVTSAELGGPPAHRHRPHDRPQRRRQGRAGRQHPDRTPRAARRSRRRRAREALRGRSRPLARRVVGRIARGHHARRPTDVGARTRSAT